jgi:predicted ABC-type ATPase
MHPPIEFANADEIAQSIAQLDATASAQQIDRRAARLMVERVDTLVKAGSSFALESTLASRTYAWKILNWRKLGYLTSLIYLRLASADEAISRVRRRVEAGGHGVPEEVIRRRFGRSAIYLEGVYKPIVNEWHIYDSLEGNFRKSESGHVKND